MNKNESVDLENLDILKAQKNLKKYQNELVEAEKNRSVAIERLNFLGGADILITEAPNLYKSPEEYVDHPNSIIRDVANASISYNEIQSKLTSVEMALKKLNETKSSKTLEMVEIVARMRRHEQVLQEKQAQMLNMENEIKRLRELASKQAGQIAELKQKFEKVNDISTSKENEIVNKPKKVDIEEDIMRYQLTSELTGHNDCIWDIATPFDGNFIVASGHDFSVRSWRYNGTTWENARNFMDHKNFVKSVDCRVVNGQLLVASASHDYTVKCWDGERGNCIWSQSHSNSVLGVAIGDRLVVSAGFSDKSYRIWELGRGTPVRTISNAFNHTAVYTRFRNPVDCNQIVTAGNEGTNLGMMKLFDVETGALTLSSKGNHNGWIWRVTVTDDGRFAITSSYVHKAIKVWDLNNGDLVRTIPGHTGGVYQLATCRYHYLVSAGQDKNVNVWNWETGNLVKSFPAKSSAYRGASCSPDGRWFSGGGGDRNVFLWSLK